MRNFVKGSLFSRNNSNEDDYIAEQSGGALAVWGSPGSGKTAAAVKIAKYLAEKKKKTALLLCDMTAPMLPCICPSSDLENAKSLGSILAATTVTDTLVRHNCILHKKLGFLTIIGMLKGENEYTYPPYSAKQAKELLESLQKIAPYMIIDCGSYIANDILSAVAIMESDAVLRLVNCDLKSVSYLSSQLPLLKDNKWDSNKQYKVASNIKKQEASEHVEQVLGSAAFKLPHSSELENQYLAGDLFKDLSLGDSKSFRREIARICLEVFGC